MYLDSLKAGMIGLVYGFVLGTIISGCEAFGPRLDPVVHDACDIIELNHYYDGSGKLVLEQYIFWDWHPADSSFRVVAWRHADKCALKCRGSLRTGYEMMLFDGEQVRRIRSRMRRETWTQYDPEVHDRQFVPQDQRTGLSRLRITNNNE